MRPDLRKIWVVASTEFGTSVRTKAFLVFVLFMPLITGLPIALQSMLAGRVDTRTRAFTVIDRTEVLYPTIEAAVKIYNDQAVDKQGRLTRPLLSLVSTDASQPLPGLSLELSDRIRRGQLDAYAVIPPEAAQPPPADRDRPASIEYHSDNPNDDIIRNWLTATVNSEVRLRRFRAAGLDPALSDRLNQPIAVDNLGLVDRAARTAPAVGAPASANEASVPTAAGAPEITAAEKVDRVRTTVVPAVLLFTMFLLVMSTTPQLLTSVIEEKISKISEVLLGSVTPFELMMGKLLGHTGIAMVLASLYAACGFAVASYYGYADVISPGILVALAVFVVLAIMLYGSLFMAVGSACDDHKDAQTLMMPVMMLSMIPLFVWFNVVRNPSGGLSVGLSLFPPASPYLMLMRLAMRPAPPAWQVGLAIAGTTLTTILCVWAAAKVFRTGLLMQGKSGSYREIFRWLMAR
jgi:ABC-2 type transport system permease protein